MKKRNLKALQLRKKPIYRLTGGYNSPVGTNANCPSVDFGCPSVHILCDSKDINCKSIEVCPSDICPPKHYF